jgi:hypothetical protein
MSDNAQVPESPFTIVTDGEDPLTKPVLDYLAFTYGIPRGDIRALIVESEVNRPQLITVTLLVRKGVSSG